jgi:fructose-bisphosphate aldolase class II
MLDLSEESKEDNIKDCVHYFKRMAKMNREFFFASTPIL